MGIYDINCPDCGKVEDIYYSLKTICGHKDEGEDLQCPECGATSTLRPAAPAITGFIETNPRHIRQIGRTFHNAAEMKQYEKQEGVYFAPKSDSFFQNQLKKTRTRVENLARRKGHRDYEAWQNSPEMKEKRGGREYKPKESK
jgi:pyridoxal biosynthesis lyase PdxS